MTSLRVLPSAHGRIRRLGPSGWTAVLLCLSCWTTATAADPTANYRSSKPTAVEDDVWVVSPGDSAGISGGNPVPITTTPSDVGGFGVNARIGHMAGQAVGRRESGTFAEIAPFTTFDHWFFGGDIRLLRPNTGDLAGSGGFILRRYNERRNTIFGANIFYDADDTRGQQFNQLGFGLEWMSAWLDIRTNAYFPTGNDIKTRATGVLRGSEQFLGNNLYYDRFSLQSTAATGMDMLFTVPVPGRLAEAVNLEASAGWYFFSPKDNRLEDFAGARLRVDASIIKRLLHTYVEYTNDASFDTNVSMGVDVNYWNKYDNQPRIGGNQFHRITDYVRRNWTVVAVDETAFDRNLLAINPATGTPYYIEHVDSNANGLLADGTFERPYDTIQVAQNTAPSPPNNIIYVHAGSVFNTPLVMNNGETILGEGVAHELALPGTSDFVILPGTGKTGGKPVFEGISGVPVTLASNTTFGGFAISQTTGGPAILGSGIANARLSDIDIEDVQSGHGIHFLNSTGQINLDNVNVLRANPADAGTGVDGDAFRVEGGNANIIYRNSRIENTQGRAVRITGAAGRVDMRTVAINSRFTVVGNTDEGVIVQDSSANVLFGPMDLQSGSLDLLDITGDVTFTGPIQLSNTTTNPENPNATALQVNGSSGLILFQPGARVNVQSRPATGIDLRNISGTIHFSDDIDVIGTVGGGFLSPALVWQENSGGFISDGTFTAGLFGTNNPAQSQGILIGSRDGALSNGVGSTFRMNGQFNIYNTFGNQVIDPGPPAVIQANSAIEILSDPTNVVFSGGTISGRNPTQPAPLPRRPTGGVEIFNTTGSIRFNGTTTIENEPLDTADPNFDPPSPESAVEMVQAIGPIFWDVLTVRAAQENAQNEAGVFGFQSGDIHFNRLNVQFNSTDNSQSGAVNISESGHISANGGTIEAGFLTNNGSGSAIVLQNNERITWVSDSVSSRNDQFGILITGQPGSFVVRGGGTPGSGGVIQDTTSTAGVDVGGFFDYTGQDPTDPRNFVELNDMIFSVSDRAIFATNMFGLKLDGVTVNNTSLSGAVLLSDVINLRVEDSIFTNNNGNVIFATIGINPEDTVFDYRFERNQFVDGAASFNASMIRIDNIGGGAGATLDLLVRDNGGPLSGFTGFVANRNNPNPANVNLIDEASAFAVRWNGAVRNALFERNSFALIGGPGQEAVEFINASTGHVTNLTFRQNTLTSNAAGDAVGLKVDLAGRGNVQILENGILNTPGTPFQGFVMNGPRDQAYQLTLRGANNRVAINDNDINFANDDTIAFNFPYIGGNTEFFINGNRIAFNQQFVSTGPGERGFVFGPIAGTMFFNGNRNNIVEYAQPDVFSIPFPNPFLAPHVGSFILNGVRVPTNP